MSDIETFEEFCNNNNCSTCRFKKIAIEMGCSNCEKHFMKEHDAKVRADAIDEFSKWLFEKNYITTDNWDMWHLDREDIVEEFLKEQKK